MKKHKILLFGIVLLCLQACQAPPVVQDTPTPEPAPTPTFETEKYGGTDLDVVYCTPERLPQKMDLYYPQSGGPWPVLLYVHGGSWEFGDKADTEGWQRLADSGYLIASINYRMVSDGKFPVMIEDVKCAVRYLRTHNAEYNLDPDRIGAIGPSSGAHLVALLGTADKTVGWDVGEYADQSSQIQAVVCLYGVYDLTVEVPPALGTTSFYVFGALAGKESPETLAASPVTHIDANDPPFLILHGTQDAMIPVEQAEIMYARLAESGVSSSLVIVENGNHGLQPYLPNKEITPTQDEINQIILDFLAENLKAR